MMEFKKANSVLLLTVMSLFIIAILVLLKVLLSDSKNLELGNVSDRISAACNIVMAGAAIFAAYSAKKWVKQRTHTVGFEKAEKLITLIDNHYGWIDLNRMQLVYLSGYLNAVHENIAELSFDKEIDYYELKSEYEVKKEELRGIYYQFELLERWGLNSRYKNLIDSTIKNMDLYFTDMITCFQIAAYWIESLRSGNDGYDNYRENLEKFMSDAVFAYQRFDEDYEKFKRIKFDDLFKLH